MVRLIISFFCKRLEKETDHTPFEGLQSLLRKVYRHSTGAYLGPFYPVALQTLYSQQSEMTKYLKTHITAEEFAKVLVG